MKGIKECIQWLFENEGKWLVNCKGDMIKFYAGKFYTTSLSSEFLGSISELHYEMFVSVKWEEYKQPYTFEEVYKMCKEEGVTFKTTINNKYKCKQIMSRNSVNDVRIEDEERRPVVLDVKWYRIQL